MPRILSLFYSLCLIWSFPIQAAILDLQSWEPVRDGTTTLSGNWDFYWGRLLQPVDFRSGRELGVPMSFPIPGVWNKVQVGEITLKANHYATYRAFLKLSENLVNSRTPLSFEISSVPGAYKLFLDGQLVVSFGTVGRSVGKEKPSIGTEVYTFVPKGTEVELIFQVSSFHHRDGGIWWPIRLGTSSQITRIRAAGVGLDGFALSCLFIMTFYHFGLYLMRREYKTALMFSIFCGFVSIRASVTGIGDINRLVFPGMSHGLQKVMEYAGFYLGVPAYYAFVRELYPQEFSKWLARVLWFLSGVFVLSTLLLPVRVFTDYIEIYQITTSLAFSIMLVQFFFAIKRRRDGVYLLLAGSMILIFSTINDILQAHRIAPIPTMIFPYGLFFMILFQSILLARRFSRAFSEVQESEKKIQSLNSELKQQNNILDQLVEEKTRDIRSIMKNIKQGIFTVVGADTMIGPEFSEHLRQLVQAPDLQSGQPYTQIFRQARLSADRRSQITTALTTAIGEEVLAFDVNSHVLPHEMQLQRSNGEARSLEVDWNPIENEHTGLVDKILVSLRDVTDLRQLQAESQRSQLELQLIGEVLEIPPEKFDGVIHSCQKFIVDCYASLNAGNVDAHRLFRNMHTIKGVARSYGLTQLADAAHASEEVFVRLRDDKAIDQEWLSRAIAEVDELVGRYDQLHRHKLGRKSNHSNTLTIDRSVIAENMASLLKMDMTDLNQDVQQRVEHLSRLFMDMIYTPLPKLLEDLLQDLPRLAAELGKENPELVIRDPGISIKHEAYDLFRNIFTHILRNALDHGLEHPLQRLQLGKRKQGRILIEMRMDEGLLDIYISDDGCGLNLSAILGKAVERDLVDKSKQLSDYEIANMIFSPGLSTKDRVTAVSGRGVGLDAVKSFIEQYNGDIEIQLAAQSSLESGVPFRFHITLPASLCDPIQAIVPTLASVS